MKVATEYLSIVGNVGAPAFATWITRHAARLGLEGRVLSQADGRVELIVQGPPDLLDAMVLGCSLGPQEVWVDRIDRSFANVTLGQDSS
jgi:acylphosphatase